MMKFHYFTSDQIKEKRNLLKAIFEPKFQNPKLEEFGLSTKISDVQKLCIIIFVYF